MRPATTYRRDQPARHCQGRDDHGEREFSGGDEDAMKEQAEEPISTSTST